MVEKRKMGYTKMYGLLYPNLTIETPKDEEIRPYGTMYHQWMEENHPRAFGRMRGMCTLTPKMIEKNKQAMEMMEQLMTSMLEKENVTEELKKVNQLLWVQKVNKIKAKAEEIVLNKVVYQI